MKSEDFFKQYGSQAKNRVVAMRGSELLLTFEGTLFDAIICLNQYFGNFRLTGVVFYTLEEPSLKEMGLLLLSRVQEVIFFRKSSLQLPEIWDKFGIHQVRKRYGREDSQSHSRSD